MPTRPQLPRRLRGSCVAGFFAGVVASHKKLGYGFAAHAWGFQFAHVKAGWRFWDKARHLPSTIGWWMHTGRVMGGGRSMLTGRKDLLSLWAWVRPPVCANCGERGHYSCSGWLRVNRDKLRACEPSDSPNSSATRERP